VGESGGRGGKEDYSGGKNLYFFGLRLGGREKTRLWGGELVMFLKMGKKKRVFDVGGELGLGWF